jgi:2-haloacid dehalogenase
MRQAIGFDVYGTLVDPLGLELHLQPLVGEQAGDFARLWRSKQLEYSFRKGLMERYENFEVCTRQALRFTFSSFGKVLTPGDEDRLLDNYQQLPRFADVPAGLAALTKQGHRLVAFSNGVERRVRELLEHAGLLCSFETVVSVDDLQMFKPHPSVYRYLQQRLEQPADCTWLVSSNPWDVIGAKAAGLRAAWVRRAHGAVFDPWGIEPDLTVADLAELAECFAALHC